MITSTSNPLVKETVNLIKKAKFRQEQDVFVVEGRKMVSELPRERFVRGFVTERFLQENGAPCMEGLPMELVSDRVMEAVSDTQTPQGILAVVKQFHYSREALFQSSTAPLFLLLERISDPGNLGTMIRAGEGAGLTGAFLSRDCVDIYNPKVIRSTMGSVSRPRRSGRQYGRHCRPVWLRQDNYAQANRAFLQMCIRDRRLSRPAAAFPAVEARGIYAGYERGMPVLEGITLSLIHI